MIYSAAPGSVFAPSIVNSAIEREATPSLYQTVPAAGEPPSIEFNLSDIVGETLEIQPKPTSALEEFDWSNQMINREYVRLEQKFLARQATPEEEVRYKSMKQDRNSNIFADRYVVDYAEIQRLKILSEKIAEIQRFLRPIRLG